MTTQGALQGALSNYKKTRDPGPGEPAGHGIGKSRGGLTTKFHVAADLKQRPLGLVVTGGHAADSTFMHVVLETISISNGRPGRPRTRPDRVIADKAYTGKPCRDYLARRGISMRTDKTARSYLTGLTLAATLIWTKSLV
ncbi:transposase [Fodinicola acaciae]|uniref:transposase n=1 Tax=Fodinicola acaciae TaxID=2681555 RepID=UPI003CCCC077